MSEKEEKEKKEEKKDEEMKDEEMKDEEKVPIRLRLLNGDLIDVEISREILEMSHPPNRDYFMKDAIEKATFFIIKPPLRSYRLHLIPNKEEDRYFDYMVYVDAQRLDCLTNKNNGEKNVRLRSLYHVLDLTDWLDEKDEIGHIEHIEHLCFHYDIDCEIKTGLIDELCKRLSEKMSPGILTWNTSSYDSSNRHQYIDDQPLWRFTCVKHLIIDSKMSEDIIRIIEYNLPLLEELTITFSNTFRHYWSTLFANTNLQRITIRYLNIPTLEYDRFKSKISEWAEWELENDENDENKNENGNNDEKIVLFRYDISKYGVILDKNYL